MGNSSPSTDIQRAQNYVWKLIPSRVSTSFTALLSGMQHGVAKYLPTEESIRAKILAIIMPSGASTYLVAGYMAAGLRMWSLKRRLGGAAQSEISYVVATWTSRGYDPALLADVRNLVTGILAP